MLEVKRKPASPSRSYGHSATTTPRVRSHPDAAIGEAQSTLSLTDNTRDSIASRPPASVSLAEPKDFLTKLPVIIGEAHFKGLLAADGLLSGQLGSSSSLNVKQRTTAFFASEPELDGDISFKDMVRVNGHIAGTVYSKTGTLIVDTGAKVEAKVDVAVAVISGTVKGDIVARERVELGPASKIYGNIWTRSIVIKNGAIFEGVCKMIEEAQMAS
jgi:cytoskeletal protein CcmA (bactofilin family)